jgi:hybrid polyketide synthase/nonribosomal peptide synthetase ACE1
MHNFTPFIFSAPSEKALSAVVDSYTDLLRHETDLDLRALSLTLAERRTAFPIKASFSANDISTLLSKLEVFGDGSGAKLITPVNISGTKARVLGVFTGQGAQWAGMASKLLAVPAAVKIIDELDESLSQLTEFPPAWSLRTELLADATSSRIGEAAISQPTCTAVQIILVELLKAAGIQFSTVVGHSSGEIGAAYAAGYLSASDAIRIAYYRGVHLNLAQGKNGVPGAMLAVGTTFEDATSFCNLRKFRGKVCVAASNSATSVTLSGDLPSIEGMKLAFEEEKKFVRLLRVDKACEFIEIHTLHAIMLMIVRSLLPHEGVF